MRVVPSDAWQARAINQLLRHFNWTYIGVVYSAGRERLNWFLTTYMNFEFKYVEFIRLLNCNVENANIVLLSIFQLIKFLQNVLDLSSHV